MQIREATEQDIPEIIEVLRASLGETSSKKTEEVWRYKHIDNPFGRSLVLVAVENESIIGVRAFMRWNWQKGNKIFSALRAVDTATHPGHQGKGIFKKLTLKALEIAKEQDHHFIFNTPNDQSLPGYLKMGWENAGKLFVRLTPVNPIKHLKGKILIQKFEMIDDERGHEELLSRYNNSHQTEDNFFTPKSLEYLSWRYRNNPVQKYLLIGDKDFFLAAYVKKQKYFNELRIAEHIFINKDGLDKIKTAVKRLGRVYTVHLISCSGGLKISRIYISGNYGPVFTVRNVRYEQEPFADLLNMNNWAYSLGDLELF